MCVFKANAKKLVFHSECIIFHLLQLHSVFIFLLLRMYEYVVHLKSCVFFRHSVFALLSSGFSTLRDFRFFSLFYAFFACVCE